MSDFFEKSEKVEETQIEIKEELKRKRSKKESPSKEYIPIRLSSQGKLDAPDVVYVRNFTGEDALNLSLAGEEDSLECLIGCLNNMVYGGFDCYYFSENDVEEIMMNILGNFWTPMLSSYRYPYEENELDRIDDVRKKRILNGEEVPTIDIIIKDLKTKVLPDNFKEPISITLFGSTVKFILPRIKHLMVAKEYVENKYGTQDNKFNYFEKDLDYNSKLDQDPNKSNLAPRTIDSEMLKEYKLYQKNKLSDFLKVKQAQLIKQVDSKKFSDDISEQVKAYGDIGLHFWKAYKEIVDQKLEYGLVKDIEVVSPITGNKVIRRFQFRYVDFLSSLDSQGTTEYSYVFGE